MTTQAHRRYYQFCEKYQERQELQKTAALEEIPEDPAEIPAFAAEPPPTIYEWLLGRKLPA